MGQTIICEYLATWESTGTQPDPKEFGFDGLYAMLEECQDTMLKLGTAANEHKRTIAELKSVDVSMYQDGYELGYENGVDVAAARIAELEAALRQETAIQETEKDKHIAYLEAMVAFYRGIEPHVKERIAELEAKLRTMSELESQHLLCINEQSTRIAELERMLFDAGAVIEEYSGLIDEKGEKVAELFNQTVSQARVIAELKSAQRYSEVSGKAQP